MKIVGLSCTQKRTSTLTDALLTAALEGFKSTCVGPLEIEQIRLIDHRIDICQAEDTCLLPEIGRCVLQDDFQHVVQRMRGADALILVTPVYGGNVPAILKIFQERLKSTMNDGIRPLGGVRALTIVHARSMLTEPTLAAVGTWYGRLNIQNILSLCFTQSGLGSEGLLSTEVTSLCSSGGSQFAKLLGAPSGEQPVYAERPRCVPTVIDLTPEINT